MSYLDYCYAQSQLGGRPLGDLGKRLAATWRSDPPFYGIVMLAMRRADTRNLEKLRTAWPEVYDELQARYNAPAALLDSDPAELQRQVWAELRGEVK